MSKIAIVTGATTGYADLLGELLLNLSHLSVFENADILVFDIDFTAEQIERIRRYPVTLQRIDHEPLPISCPDPQRRHLVSTIRPRMRDIFPGYEIYIYLEVDVWLRTAPP